MKKYGKKHCIFWTWACKIGYFVNKICKPEATLNLRNLLKRTDLKRSLFDTEIREIVVLQYTVKR